MPLKYNRSIVVDVLVLNHLASITQKSLSSWRQESCYNFQHKFVTGQTSLEEWSDSY